jgi:hypothetical protein
MCTYTYYMSSHTVHVCVYISTSPTFRGDTGAASERERSKVLKGRSCWSGVRRGILKGVSVKANSIDIGIVMDIEGVEIGIALTGEGIRLSRPFEIPVVFTYIDTCMCIFR